MSKRKYVNLCLLLCFCCAVSAELDSTPQWDLLIFTQHWPITVCQEWEEKNQSHQCLLPKDQDTWTVHGIWPTRFGSIGPQFCNRSWHFDPEQIRPIEAELTELWINIEKDTSTYSFWAHEWNKHGTCAAVVDELNSEMKYFSQGINWLRNYTMLDILNDAGIVPANDVKYPIENINRAIRQKLGVDPVIECRKEKGQNYLFELRICFDKELQLKNCDGVIGFSRTMVQGDTLITNCDTSAGIIYPRDVKPPTKSYYVQLYYLISWIQWLTL